MFKLFGFLIGGSVAILALVILNSKEVPDNIKTLAEENELTEPVEELVDNALAFGKRAVDVAKDVLVESNESEVDRVQISDFQLVEPEPSLPLSSEEVNTSDITAISNGTMSNSSDQSMSNDNTIAWEVFWSFSYQYSAIHFAKHLSGLTGLELNVFPTKSLDFAIAYPYSTEAERIRNKQLLEEHGSIKLRNNVPLSVAVN